MLSRYEWDLTVRPRPGYDLEVQEDAVKFDVLHGQDLYSRRVYRAHI